jgi:hypothetical protein
MKEENISALLRAFLIDACSYTGCKGKEPRRRGKRWFGPTKTGRYKLPQRLALRFAFRLCDRCVL